MQTSSPVPSKQQTRFPPFDLKRLLLTVFSPQKREKLCILIDLENPEDIINLAFLNDKKFPVQKKAYELFYQGVRKGIMQELDLGACDIFAYKMTGGSNLELPDNAIALDGTQKNFAKDIYPVYDIIMCIGTFSATAPLTASSKKFGFRGSTMHGMNDIVLQSGLAVDYNEVSHQAEILRKGMTQADSVDIDFEVDQKSYHLHIDLARQEAQKSHGLCRTAPDIANLPAGEVYFVPKDVSGDFPIKFEEDGTLGLMHVEKGKITQVSLIRGNPEIVKLYQTRFDSDPASALLGELGFGTQVLPYSGADIQDEKIFGTFHLATGRNDHLNGDITLQRFKHKRNASHNDILFSSTKTPEIHVKQVRMKRQGKTEILIENYQPAPFLLNLHNADVADTSLQEHSHDIQNKKKP